jgi:hypothetical protein
MRMFLFLFLAGCLVATGVVIAPYSPEPFSVGAWAGGLTLFVFAWNGRSVAMRDATGEVMTLTNFRK